MTANFKPGTVPPYALNLSEGFTPTSGMPIPFKSFVFPSGIEPHIKILDTNTHFGSVVITSRVESMNDLMTIFLATDALRRAGVTLISLFLGQMPFARQDRAMVDGEPLSLAVAAKLINSQGYQKVWILDPHSDTTLALVENSIAIPNDQFIQTIMMDLTKTYGKADATDLVWVAPDAGAQKKIFSLAKRLDVHVPILTGTKVRNLATGEILRLELDQPAAAAGKHALIIDDICDGGRTFTELAKVLLEAGATKVSLAVTHGLLTKGLSPFKDLIGDIYTTNSVRPFNAAQDLPHGNVKLFVIPV